MSKHKRSKKYRKHNRYAENENIDINQVGEMLRNVDVNQFLQMLSQLNKGSNVQNNKDREYEDKEYSDEEYEDVEYEDIDNKDKEYKDEKYAKPKSNIDNLEMNNIMSDKDKTIEVLNAIKPLVNAERCDLIDRIIRMYSIGKMINNK